MIKRVRAITEKRNIDKESKSNKGDERDNEIAIKREKEIKENDKG